MHQLSTHITNLKYQQNFRKSVHKCLFHFLDQNEILCNNQNGFRNNQLAIHTLTDITEEIRNALDNENYACGVFIDLEKAFDTVNHAILIDKWKYYGVRRITNNWFKSFLKPLMYPEAFWYQSTSMGSQILIPN